MITIATDCSGIECPLMALIELKILFKQLWSCDVDANCRKAQELNFDKPDTVYKDIFKRDHSLLPKVDLYIAGFPCQSFSSAGKLRGFTDIRGTIIYQIIETIKHSSPECFILENVKGLLFKKFRNEFEYILEKLRKLNYNVQYKLLYTNDFGIPQARPRVWIVGLKPKYKRFEYPTPIPLTTTPYDYLETNPIDYKVSEATLTKRMIKIINERGVKRNSHLIGKDQFISCNEGFGSRHEFKVPTLMCASSQYIYSTKLKRTLSLREIARLQGIPDWFQFVSVNSGFKQLGNGQSVNVLMALFKQVFISLNTTKKPVIIKKINS
jgi:DNA (cytosine-5)-methyltransferase 1